MAPIGCEYFVPRKNTCPTSMPRCAREHAAVAPRTGVAGARLSEVREASAGEVAGLLQVDEVLVGAIRARTAPLTPRSEASARTRTPSPTGPAKPTGAPGDALDRRLVGEGRRLTAECRAQLRLRDLVIAAHQHRHRGTVAALVDERLHETLGGTPRNAAHLGDGALAGRRDALERAAARDGRRQRLHLGLLDVGSVPAALARHDRVLARLGQHLELVREVAADVAGVGLDGAEGESAALEDARVGVVHDLVLASRVVGVDVEGVGVLHDELAPAHEPEARPHLVAELDLDLVEILRQIAVRAHLAADQVGDHLLVRGPEAEVPPVAVLQPEQRLAVLVPAPALLPQLGGDHGRHEHLLGPGTVHLVAHDRFHPLHGAQAERQEDVDAARDLADHAGTHQQLVAHDLGVGGIVTQGRGQEAREPRHFAAA